jgi:hypothetical protein
MKRKAISKHLFCFWNSLSYPASYSCGKFSNALSKRGNTKRRRFRSAVARFEARNRRSVLNLLPKKLGDCAVQRLHTRFEKSQGFVTIWILAYAALCWPGLSRGQEQNILPPGMYRLEMIMASNTKLPFLGSSKSASQSISLVEIHQDASGIVQNHKVCDFRVLDSALIKMVFPQEFIAALAKPSYPIQLEKEGQGWRYRADLGVEKIGYHGGAVDDRLPTKMDDPAVFDWDGDGQPGATLKLSIPLLPNGELYIVQRGQSILTGRVAQLGRVEGNIEVRQFDQRVIGARPGFLARSPEIEPDPKESRFTLSQVAGDSTCETLRASSMKP